MCLLTLTLVSILHYTYFCQEKAVILKKFSYSWGDYLLQLEVFWIVTFYEIVKLMFYCCHGTKIRTRIANKKITCGMRNSSCRWFIVTKAKIF